MKRREEGAQSSSSSTGLSRKIHVFWNSSMLLHDTRVGMFCTGMDVLEKHLENADSVKNTVSILRKGLISPYLSWFQGIPAKITELLSFHTLGYIGELVQADAAGGKTIREGTVLNPGSWDASLLAAGTTLSAMQHMLDGNAKIAYALLRPPGHHAQPTQADGYCFLNNAGLAVQLAGDSGCTRVVVIEIDVQHGDGTAEGFYRPDNVRTISLHMNYGSWSPSHPQTVCVDELGDGKGFGFNLNIPLPNGTSDRDEHVMMKLVVPDVEKFNPEVMVLVIGQDRIYCF